jgi:hypothetical protein
VPLTLNSGTGVHISGTSTNLTGTLLKPQPKTIPRASAHWPWIVVEHPRIHGILAVGIRIVIAICSNAITLEAYCTYLGICTQMMHRYGLCPRLLLFANVRWIAM